MAMDVFAGIERGIAGARQYCAVKDPGGSVVPMLGTQDTECVTYLKCRKRS